MSHVRGYYRRDGSYVRPHHRQTRKAVTADFARPTVSQQATAAGHTRVRGHYRNGAYVRPHTRRLGHPATAVATGGGGVLLFIALFLFLGSCGANGATASSPTPTSPAVASPAEATH